MSRSNKDTIVAVRLPKGLLLELKDLQKINHFMDMSDEIRYVVRKYCMPKQETKEGYIEQKQKDKVIEELRALLNTLQQNEKQE